METAFDERLTLLCKLSEANTLQEVTDIGYELFGNPLFITDMSHTILAYTKVAYIDDKTWQQDVVKGTLERKSIQQNKEVQSVHFESTKNRLPILVRDDEKPFPRLVKTLVQNDRPIGAVVLPGILQPLTPVDIQLLELLSAFVYRLTLRDRYLFSPNENAIENYIIKLLDGAAFSTEEVKTRMEIFNLHLQPYLYILVMRPEDREDETVSAAAMLSHLSSLPYCRAFKYDNEIVMILSRKDMVADWFIDESELCVILAEWSVYVGASNAFQDLSKIRDHYLEAVVALRFGRSLDKRHYLYPYSFFSVYHMLEKLPASINLRSFCHEKILKLENSDDSQDRELLITLQVYLENAHSLAKTAEILFIHKNTVRYRISKCKEIMASDLKSGSEIFSFLLSLRVIEYEKKLKQNSLFIDYK